MAGVLIFLSWFVCLPAAVVFSYWWGMSSFGSSYLGALVFGLLAIPATLGVSFGVLRKRSWTAWIALVAAEAPWIAFPIVALCSFVPRGERGQWIALLILTLTSSAIGAVASWFVAGKFVPNEAARETSLTSGNEKT